MPASVSKACTVRFDNNKYLVLSTAVGRPVEIHAYAGKTIVRQDAWLSPSTPTPSGAATRCAILAIAGLCPQTRCTGNGGPFRDWPAMERVRRRLNAAHDSNWQMVVILAAVLTGDIDAVEPACQEALDQNVVIIKMLARGAALRWSAISHSREPAGNCSSN